MTTEKDTKRAKHANKDGTCCIRTKFIPSKLAYLFYYGVLGAYMPIMNVFFVSIGLTASQAGFISGLRMIVANIAGPVWGYLADKSNRHFLVVNIISLGTLLTLLPMPWIAKSVQSSCIGGHRHITTNVTSGFYEPCHDSHMFAIMLGVGLLSAVFDTTPRGFIDAYVMEIVQSDPAQPSIGHQKLFAPIGFASATFLTAYVSAHYRHDTLSNYTASFFLFLPLATGCVPIFIILTKQFQEVPKDNTVVTQSSNVFRTFFKLPNFTFFITVMLVGLCDNVLLGFLFLFLEKEVEISTTVTSLAFVVAGASESLFMAIAKPLIRIVKGPINGFLIGIFSYAVRYLLLSFVVNPWLVLPIQCLHALGSGLFWISTAMHTQDISTEANRATMFTLVTSIFGGLGPFVGHMAGGVIIDKFSGRILFRGVSALCLFWSVTAYVIFAAYKQRTSATVSFEMKEKKISREQYND